jgi:predicted ATPase/class 3 adenylate cyclase
MSRLPSGTITFLFTDIEGSTRLVRELGERYPALLAEHRRRLRAAFERHGGVEIGTHGDAFFVAFESAPDAVEAAGAGQAALGDGPVRVRMGLHSGEATEIEGSYAGINVHRAARICSAAHGGQVVLSEQTLGLAEVDGPVRDLGRHRLKDLAQAERLYQLGGADFPPLRSLNATNLPVQPTQLIGRTGEVARAIELLRSEDVRLLTLTGAGGSGKTRLALQVAAELVDDFADGVLWVPLSALSDPAFVLPTIGRTLGATNAVAEHVDEKHMLLLLDNFEHVLAAAPDLSDLLASCQNLHLLVTSRAVLRIAAEREFEVPPLPERDAVSMFVERARAIRPDVAPDEHIAGICRRLDGLPLAIELAAPRVRVLSTEQLAARLEQRLPILAAGGRDAPARQRTLRATIDWSHDLLGREQQRRFARLAVFAGTFTVEAAETVCDVSLSALSDLIEHSLLRRWASGRIGMLETIREYAIERFEGLAEAEELRRRHFEHVLELAERAKRELEAGASQEEWLGRLDAERDGIRGALGWSLSSGAAVQGLRLASTLEKFWVVRDHVEGLRWLSKALVDADDAPPGLRASALRSAGSTIFLTGDYVRAAALAEEALELFRALGDKREVARMLDRLAAAQVNLKRLDAARASAEESLALLEELGDREGALYPLEKLGWIEWENDHRERAVELIEESLAGAREFGDSWWEAAQLDSLAEMALDQGDLARANRLCRESLTLALEIGDRLGVGHCVALLAAVAARRGDPERAGCLWGGLDALEAAGDPPVLAEVRASRGEGIDWLERAVAAGREMSADEVLAYALEA